MTRDDYFGAGSKAYKMAHTEALKIKVKIETQIPGILIIGQRELDRKNAHLKIHQNAN